MQRISHRAASPLYGSTNGLSLTSRRRRNSRSGVFSRKSLSGSALSDSVEWDPGPAVQTQNPPSRTSSPTRRQPNRKPPVIAVETLHGPVGDLLREDGLVNRAAVGIRIYESSNRPSPDSPARPPPNHASSSCSAFLSHTQRSRRAWINTNNETAMSTGDEYTPGMKRFI